MKIRVYLEELGAGEFYYGTNADLFTACAACTNFEYYDFFNWEFV